jgi:hypothetical protein
MPVIERISEQSAPAGIRLVIAERGLKNHDR